MSCFNYSCSAWLSKAEEHLPLAGKCRVSTACFALSVVGPLDRGGGRGAVEELTFNFALQIYALGDRMGDCS